MSLAEQIKNGNVYVEAGHSDPADRAYAAMLKKMRIRAKDVAFRYNNTLPSNYRKKEKILRQLLGSLGINPFIEAPVHFSYGYNTSIGSNFYANFNLVIVDDGEVHIGDNVMCAPNVTIATTGHPLHPEIRRHGAQFSLPVTIGDDVWLGANVVVLPGVTIGAGSVIGAGSIVTRDIPEMVLAFGVPCRVVRAITGADRDWVRNGVLLNQDWHGQDKDLYGNN